MQFRTFEVKDGQLGPDFDDQAVDCGENQLEDGWYYLADTSVDAEGPFDSERQAEEYGHLHCITEELAARATAIVGDTAEKAALVRIVGVLRSDWLAPTGP